eukprot:jgi/Mesvir1/24238/Mv10944-RA.1
MAEKLTAAVDEAVSASDDNDRHARAVEVLQEIATMPVTMELLLQTQVGKKVKKLSKHSNPEVAKHAKVLVEAWRKIVEEESRSKNSPSQPAGPSEGASSGALKRKGSTSSVSDAGSKTPKTSGSSFSLPPLADPIRDKIRQNIMEALQLAQGQEGTEGRNAGEVATDIEAEMYEVFVGASKDMKEYKAKYRTIHFNLKDPKNPDLRHRVLSGNLHPSTLLRLTPEEMASEAKRAENSRIRMAALNESLRGSNELQGGTTDQFRCGKCKQRKCTYFQMQTRSADEPMTTFVTCVNCNNRWKFC